VNSIIGILREEWESQLQAAYPELEWKTTILNNLNGILHSQMPALEERKQLWAVCKQLSSDQEELMAPSLLPVNAEQWVQNKIEPKWVRLLNESSAWSLYALEIKSLLERLRASLQLGMDVALSEGVTSIPYEIKEKWRRLSYTYFTADNIGVLSEILELLQNPALPLPHKQQMQKALRSMKVLLEVIPEVEERANRIILSLKDGSFSEADALKEIEEICRRTVSTDVVSRRNVPILLAD
jgi:hypothetical protein